MVAALTALLLATAAGPFSGVRATGLTGDLLFLASDSIPLDEVFVDEGAPQHHLPAAPRAVLSADDRSSPRGGAEALPMSLSLETWQGTLCLKGAWSIRASERPERKHELGPILRELQISPAVLADGARIGPGIGASTRF